MNRNRMYAAGSIVEAIESGQTLRNVGGGHIHKEATVSGVNRYGFKIITEHYYSTSAKLQRDWLKETGCTEIT